MASPRVPHEGAPPSRDSAKAHLTPRGPQRAVEGRVSYPHARSAARTLSAPTRAHSGAPSPAYGWGGAPAPKHT
eukprot:4993629-Pleurochrysis_carterae.AAC.1